jgi:hypothetical protein
MAQVIQGLEVLRHPGSPRSTAMVLSLPRRTQNSVNSMETSAQGKERVPVAFFIDANLILCLTLLLSAIRILVNDTE